MKFSALRCAGLVLTLHRSIWVGSMQGILACGPFSGEAIMTSRTIAIAAILGSCLSAAPAAALTVNLYDFGGATITGEGFTSGTFSQGGITGTITAGCDLGGDNSRCDQIGSVPKITQSSSGLGVDTSGDHSNQLETANDGEYLTFVFDSLIKLVKITFASFDPGSCDDGDYRREYSIYSGGSSGCTMNYDDAYDLLVNGETKATGSHENPWDTSFDSVSYFTVVADKGKFYVKSFEVEIAAVPLPAGGILLLSALSGLGVVRKRRRTAALA